MIRQIPTSIEDFRKLREADFEYIDKTHLITQILDRANYNVILLPRPRRFGKTLNMTTLRWFFEKREENVWHLFEGLHVANAGEQYRAHFQKYPVVFISLKETKALTFEECFEKAKLAIRRLYEHHWPVLEGHLKGGTLRDFTAILENTAHIATYQASLSLLTQALHKVHGVRPIVLIDEYDAGIHAAHSNGFYKEAIGFFGGFFLAGLKDNTHLERAVLTGILRVSQESIFSDLNSIGVYDLLQTPFNTCFGFTQHEVEGLLQRVEQSNMLDKIRLYYNGYEFGGVEIYNPWSILSFLANPDRELVPYWVGTSSNALIQELFECHGFALERDIRILMEGGAIEKRLNQNIVFPRLHEDPDTVWNLLVFAGYLKAARQEGLEEDMSPRPHLVSIPNREVKTMYRTVFQSWLKSSLTSRHGSLSVLLNHLLDGDYIRFEEQLQKLAETMPSYHDVLGTEPEKFFHGLMVGLLASLEPEYAVRSNRESGPGRPDVMITPRRPGKPGVILELKTANVTRNRTLEQAMKEGLEQLEKNDYAVELRAAGVASIQQMAIAFDGKRVMVLPKGAKPPKPKRKSKGKG